MKYCVTIILSLFLIGCSKTDSSYYWQNPEKLKLALKSCPRKKPAGVSCDDLISIASKFQYLGGELRQNPQLFGMNIITLQQKIAKMEQQLQTKHDEQLKRTLQKEKDILSQFLAVVSYYESPRGARYEDFGQ